MSDFGETVVRRLLSEEVKTERYHPLGKKSPSVSYDFYITKWNCLGEVKTKFNASKSGFSIPKKTLKRYKEYTNTWKYEYIFYFVDINSRAIYSVNYDDFKRFGVGTHNDNLSSVKYYPKEDDFIGEITREDYRDFTLNYSKDRVKSYEF